MRIDRQAPAAAGPVARVADERLPLSRLLILGFQHVLVMYPGDIAVPRAQIMEHKRSIAARIRVTRRRMIACRLFVA